MISPMTRATGRVAAGLGLLVMFGAASVVGAPGVGAEPQLRADYRFNNVLTSTIPGAPPLHDINRAATDNEFATENVDGVNRRVLQFPEANGLRLNNLHRIMRTVRYTIAVRMRFDTVTDYRRVLNFKPHTATHADTGVYILDNDLVFYNRAFPTTDSIDADEWVTVVLTRAAHDTVRGYVDGVQQFAFVDHQNRTFIDSHSGLRFFRDDGSGEASSGAVARIRIWNAPMTPAQVAALPQ